MTCYYMYLSARNQDEAITIVVSSRKAHEGEVYSIVLDSASVSFHTTLNCAGLLLTNRNTRLTASCGAMTIMGQGQGPYRRLI